MIDRAALQMLLKSIAASGLTPALREQLGPECVSALERAAATVTRQAKQQQGPAHRPDTLILVRAYQMVEELIINRDASSRTRAYDKALRLVWDIPGARAAFPNRKFLESALELAIVKNRSRIPGLARKIPRVQQSEMLNSTRQMLNTSAAGCAFYTANDTPPTQGASNG